MGPKKGTGDAKAGPSTKHTVIPVATEAQKPGTSKETEEEEEESANRIKLEVDDKDHSCMTYSSVVQLLLFFGLFCMFRWGYECESILAIYHTPSAIPTNLTVDFPALVDVNLSSLCGTVPNAAAAISIMIFSVFLYGACSILQCVLYRPICSDSCCVC